jgi:putative membrane protein
VLEKVTVNSKPDQVSVELSARRTGMSFQRTRMSADRTLMSVVRTSLSLIGFGFTIFQFFEKLRDAGTLTHGAAPRHFGVALVALGILMLIGGIIYHVQFMCTCASSARPWSRTSSFTAKANSQSRLR